MGVKPSKKLLNLSAGYSLMTPGSGLVQPSQAKPSSRVVNNATSKPCFYASDRCNFAKCITSGFFNTRAVRNLPIVTPIPILIFMIF